MPEGEPGLHGEDGEFKVRRPEGEDQRATTEEQVASEFSDRVEELVESVDQIADNAPDTLVQDQELAESMAYGEDPDRTLEAGYNKLAKAAEEFESEDLPPMSYSSANSERFFTENKGNPAVYDMSRNDLRTVKTSIEYSGDDTHSSGETAVKIAKKYAEAKGKRADRAGEWAAVLHEHPVSDDYIDRMGLREQRITEITAATLTKIEDHLTTMRKKITEWEAKLPQVEAMVAEKGGSLITEVSNQIETLWGKDSEAMQRFNELSSQDETTIKDLKKCFAELCAEEVAGSVIVSALADRILDDVRSGRASQASSSS